MCVCGWWGGDVRVCVCGGGGVGGGGMCVCVVCGWMGSEMLR